MNSKMPSDQKDKLVIKTIKNYLMTSQADVIMSSSSCDNTRSVKYIKEMKMQNFDQVPSSYISKYGSSQNTCEFNQAVQMYNMVGDQLVTNDQLCSVMTCERFIDSTVPTKVAPVTASPRPIWKYSGVRKYFIEKEKSGWRYLCVATNAKGKVLLSEKVVRKSIAELEKSIAQAEASCVAINSSALPTAFKKNELSWKLVSQVDLW